MANVLKRDKQVAALSMLLEGSSIRSTERVVGVHRDTIIRLMIRVARTAEQFSSSTLRDLPCKRIEVDEIWAFVAKKNKNVVEADDWTRVGDQYTFVALDPETKLIPSHLVGKRTTYTAMQFMDDLAKTASSFPATASPPTSMQSKARLVATSTTGRSLKNTSRLPLGVAATVRPPSSAPRRTKSSATRTAS